LFDVFGKLQEMIFSFQQLFDLVNKANLVHNFS